MRTYTGGNHTITEPGFDTVVTLGSFVVFPDIGT